MENTDTVPVAVTDKEALQSVYWQLINSWNDADAEVFTSVFAQDGSLVGFDGSQANGRNEINDHLTSIFADHEPAKFITIIKEIRFLTSGVGLLRAVAGMVQPGQLKINPATNAIQSMVAVKDNDVFRISLFQNTPAAFHGRPMDAEKLTDELQEQLKKEWK